MNRHTNPVIVEGSPVHEMQGNATAAGKAETTHRFAGKPYLQCLETLEGAFPALKSFLEKLAYETDPGRQAVQAYHKKNFNRVPGRCYCLEFGKDSVTSIQPRGFESPAALRAYFEKHPAAKSREEKHRRLFILEDIEPDYVDALGHHLGVDPMVFSEQMNTWNFTDSWSIPFRGLPSMSVPGHSFTLRYYELRTLFDPASVDVLSMQFSFAINRRRYERWRDIDVPSLGKPDRRHAFVRRCASFWTSQDAPRNGDDEVGWDAVIMVDPSFAVAKDTSQKAATSEPSPGSKKQRTFITPDGIKLDGAALASREECLVLSAEKPFPDRASLWRAQDWGKIEPLEGKLHKSWPYHDGCSTLAPLMFSQVGIGAKEANIRTFQDKRNTGSPMDEMVFYWTRLATPGLIRETNLKSSNAAYYLLKHVAQHWVNQLELINTTIARAEWFSDDYQAQVDDKLTRQRWKADLLKINEIAKDINYMRRHLNHFWRAMYLNLERLGVQLGSESVDDNASIALRGAQKDFLTIHTRMQPLRDRAEALNSVSNDLANLRAAFRGVADGEFSMRLSLFASIVFPLTLVAGIFSMNENYLPRAGQFWKLWAIGVPVCIGVAVALMYGRHPWMVFFDLKNNTKDLLQGYGYCLSSDEKRKFERNKEAARKRKLDGKVSDVTAPGHRKGWKKLDEELGI